MTNRGIRRTNDIEAKPLPTLGKAAAAPKKMPTEVRTLTHNAFTCSASTIVQTPKSLISDAVAVCLCPPRDDSRKVEIPPKLGCKKKASK